MPPALPTLQVILTDAQLDDLAARIARKLAALPPPTYDQRRLPPYLTKRRFLAAAKRGAFPSKKVGRTVVATRADVEQWVAAQPSAKRKTTSEDEEYQAVLDANRARARSTRAR